MITIGIILTTISALFLALTVTTDKLMVADFYESDPRKAWFVSSFFGAILGLAATAVAWSLFASENLFLEYEKLIAAPFDGLVVGMLLTGVLVSLNLRFYFTLMNNAYTTLVAVAIASTPVFVFAIERLLYGGWTTAGVLSVLLTVAGFILFDYVTEKDGDEDNTGFNWPLIGFLVLSTAYLLLADWLFEVGDAALSISSTDTSLLLMPFYWIGFAIGTTDLRHPEVRSFLKTIVSRWHFLLIVVVLEIIGAGFYFFEFFGLAELEVSLVALIIGAHVVAVYLFDVYLRKKYQRAQGKGEATIKVLFFTLEIDNLEEYNIPSTILKWQFLAIALILTGLWLWP